MTRKLLCTFLCACLAVIFTAQPAFAKKPSDKGHILFVPHDNRPISDEQTADTIRKLGWEIDVPPDDMLGGRGILGKPEKVWDWLEERAKTADIAVLSSDTLLYGSLVGSRKHQYSESEIRERVDRFREFKKSHPKMKLYVWGSIMRTPRSAEASGGEEPSYYASFGNDIFRYTALTDKQETEGLTRREKKEYEFLQKLIPQKAMDDWLDRRKKNFAASRAMIALARDGKFDYFALGRDDNAPHSQTHMESRKLSEAGKDLPASKFQSLSGIDEFGLLMLTRAVNDWTKTVPFVYVKYNWGRGGETIPAYSDEKISETIKGHVTAAGGMLVTSPKNADFTLLVNTNPNGRTGEANDRKNDTKPHEGTKYFADLVEDSIASGKPTCVADIAYANGSDNALMEMLKNRGLLYKLRAYGGWNTATNSTGFVLAQGMLAEKMTPEAMDALLTTRYLDDWGYQANVRTLVARQLGWFRATGAYASLDAKRPAIEDRASQFMRRFAEENLPPMEDMQYLTVHFPWNRMFEARFSIEPPFNFKAYMEEHRAE